MKKKILEDMDKLHHDKNGFYDCELDLYFDDITEWLNFKYGLKWSEILI